MALTERFAEAVRYAAIVHATQVRKGTDVPYIGHLLGVASLVVDAGGEEDLAIAALLHDAAEDHGGEARLADIRARFGDRVTRMVEECSDSLTEDPEGKEEWKVRKQEHLGRLESAGRDTLIVVAADKVHNARAIVTDLQTLGPDRAFRRFKGTPRQVLWYYEENLRIAMDPRNDLPPALTAPLLAAVDQMRTHIAAAGG
ncbi:MAG: HD domain-containing protein [Actinobacteria bacterium]|nr:HD domain-containing protein [Actinomycetota bacterium]